jgi:hypothetical protein
VRRIGKVDCGGAKGEEPGDVEGNTVDRVLEHWVVVERLEPTSTDENLLKPCSVDFIAAYGTPIVLRVL